MLLAYPDYESIIDLYKEGIYHMYKLHEIHGNKDEGPIRAAKGELVENMVDAIVHLAWYEIGGEVNRLNIEKQKEKIYIDANYIQHLTDEFTREYIERNRNGYFYPIELDRAVKIDNQLVLGVECKAYTDNTMFRRALKDFELALKLYPELLFCVFQLENGLGGDYGEASKLKPLGSKRTHTLMSHALKVKLEIITLLDGNRKSKRGIHKREYFKELPIENVAMCVSKFRSLLESFA